MEVRPKQWNHMRDVCEDPGAWDLLDPVTSSTIQHLLSPQASCLDPSAWDPGTHFPLISVGPSRWAFRSQIGELKGKAMKTDFH